MTKLIATLCTALALLVGLPAAGTAQGLQPLRADDPPARFVAGLVEPMLAGDEAAAAAYLLRHAAPEANRDSLELRLGEVLATIRSQEAPRIETFFLGGPGGADVLAALASATGLRLLVGTRMSEDRSAIIRLVATPAWTMTFLPTPPEPSIPGLLAIPETPATVAFVDIAVVPMDEERMLRSQTVLVRDGRIVQMGRSRSVRVPRGAYVIDGAGKYLMPGLVIYGTSDFLTSAAEHHFIAGLVNRERPRLATLRVLENMDHYFQNVASYEESVRVAQGQGAAEFDTRIHDELSGWMARAQTSAREGR